MFYYPQLSTGSVAQFPLRRTSVTRSVINLLADGSAVKLADPCARADRWELRYAGLSDAERAALEQFFRATDGPLYTFVYLDPEGNLLRWSEDPTQSVWQHDGLVNVTTDETGAAQVLNRGQADYGIEQIVSAPGWYQYCFSASVRSGSPDGIQMLMGNADGQLVSNWTCTPDWQRVWCSGAIAGESDEIRCRLEVQAGASVQVRGMQLQAQPMPGAYRATRSDGGVYSARFAQERIDFRADGPDDHATVIEIVGRPGV